MSIGCLVKAIYCSTVCRNKVADVGPRVPVSTLKSYVTDPVNPATSKKLNPYSGLLPGVFAEYVAMLNTTLPFLYKVKVCAVELVTNGLSVQLRIDILIIIGLPVPTNVHGIEDEVLMPAPLLVNAEADNAVLRLAGVTLAFTSWVVFTELAAMLVLVIVAAVI